MTNNNNEANDKCIWFIQTNAKPLFFLLAKEGFMIIRLTNKISFCYCPASLASAELRHRVLSNKLMTFFLLIFSFLYNFTFKN